MKKCEHFASPFALSFMPGFPKLLVYYKNLILLLTCITRNISGSRLRFGVDRFLRILRNEINAPFEKFCSRVKKQDILIQSILLPINTVLLTRVKLYAEGITTHTHVILFYC